MVKLTAFVIIFIFILGCKDPKLISPLENLNTNLKLNGYYYTNRLSGNQAFTNIVFLYTNGVIFDCFSTDKSDLTALDGYIKNEILKYDFNTKYHKLHWGITNIRSNNISIELWYPSSGGPFPVYIRKGNILNDSTFVLLSSETQKGKDKKVISETYHFRQFSPKPDSSNNFVK